jgi:PKD repeat protein
MDRVQVEDRSGREAGADAPPERAGAALLRVRACACAGVLALALALTAAATAGASAGHVAFARLVHVCAPPNSARAGCFAVARRPASAAASGQPDVRSYTTSPAAEAGPAGGYTPAQLASAYGYDPSGGAGQTVAIVDAYDDPKIQEDLNEFDAHYGLGECTKKNGCFRKVNQAGGEKPLPAFDPEGWSQEISLDVETVRAACHGCKIVLVETTTPSYENLAKGVNEAVALGATEVSNSYGGPEREPTATENAAYNHPGVVITAATGDFGWEDWTLGVGEVNAPASLPSVVSVGGTSLHLNAAGKRSSETVWNDYGVLDEHEVELAGYASSGGCSQLHEAQLWQREAPGFGAAGCSGNGRLSADVAADADPLTGFDIRDTYNFCGTGPQCKELIEAIKAHEGWQTFGGTSLSAPLIASLYALAGGSGGLKYPALTLYGRLGDASSLYDVTQGGNGLCDAAPASTCGHPNAEFAEVLDCEGTSSCDARAGFDGPSGVGAPIGLSAFEPTFPTAVATPPTRLVEGKSGTFSAAASRDPYPGGSMVGWSWKWGDGAPDSSEAAPDHTYAAPGEYKVSLTVTDNYGLTSATTEQTVHVLTAAEAKQLEEEEEAARKKHEEEEAARKQHEEEEARQHKEEEEAARKQHEEEEARHHKEEEEARTEREEHEATQHKEEEAAAQRHREEEQAAQHRHEEEATQRHHEEELARQHQEEEARAKASLQQVAGFTSAGQQPVPAARLASVTLVVRSDGMIGVRLVCPAGVVTCAGTLTLRTLAAVLAEGGRSAGRRAVLTMGSASFSVVSGATKAIPLRLSHAARAYFAHHHPLRAQMAIAAHDPAGSSHLERQVVTLRPAPPRHRS